ncbi:MAG: glycosyltransferase family 4 protein [Kiritimatiellia bacterium]|jgi:glycosyltransferase involved in cell wall biosynthesis|nr:glycosyltransferase family 4 protein [Kiritimatiellia bacterium]MDD4173016.1 glycosyltransferase family 4 protein [Kiritimatiellia bacterium]MDD4441425.1 glycosyltransferase family 4 protein [Kiritimatiellia bacterium]MDX9794750.1 glycosyltransferase family 4 protein [Kiritimatiellia bacterium]NLC80280.1 glycosyltransferase family 4 protein [Lentisphaerota bacterium]
MRVLWVDLISELGGAQYSLLEVCGGLAACGVEVVAAVPQGPLFERLSAKGIPIFPVSPVRASRRGWGLFSTAAKLMRAPSTVCQIIRAVKPDIIHANSLPAFLASRKTFSHIPLVWHVRDLRLPVVIARDAAKKASRIIAASEAIDEYLVEILSPSILGRIRVVRNGIDPASAASVSRAAARQRFGLPAEAPVVGMVAHLIPWKRHDAFVMAAAEIRRQRPDVHFALVGRNLFNEHARWAGQLEKMVDQAGLADVFHWITASDDAAQILPAFDVLLHPALGEPFGRVLCEAMAASVPVIAAESGGPCTIIEQGVSGILVRGGEPIGMAEETLGLLADPARAAALAAAGRTRVLSQFTVAKVCEQLAKEYRALIAATSTGHDDE